MGTGLRPTCMSAKEAQFSHTLVDEVGSMPEICTLCGSAPILSLASKTLRVPRHLLTGLQQTMASSSCCDSRMADPLAAAGAAAGPGPAVAPHPQRCGIAQRVHPWQQQDLLVAVPALHMQPVSRMAGECQALCAGRQGLPLLQQKQILCLPVLGQRATRRGSAAAPLA